MVFALDLLVLVLRLDNMGEEDLDRLREQRLLALKKQQKKRQEWIRKGHGEYREVEEKEFFNEMKVSHPNVLNWKALEPGHLLTCRTALRCSLRPLWPFFLSKQKMK